uniref:Uncharacterized protein n=1 Tax=Anopheles maculatus TaxID=74869 RepID=A0A182S6K8_9DIPT
SSSVSQQAPNTGSGRECSNLANQIVAPCTPKDLGEGRAEIMKSSGYIFSSLKPSPSLSLFSSVTNLFYHHRKAFRRKNGTGRNTVAAAAVDEIAGRSWQGGSTIMDAAALLQFRHTIATVYAVMDSIIFVVVALAISSTIATATVVLVQFRTNPMASLRS